MAQGSGRGWFRKRQSEPAETTSRPATSDAAPTNVPPPPAPSAPQVAPAAETMRSATSIALADNEPDPGDALPVESHDVEPEDYARYAPAPRSTPTASSPDDPASGPDVRDADEGRDGGADSVEPASVEPASVEPASTEPASVESASTEPASTEPTRSQPIRSEAHDPMTAPETESEVSLPAGQSDAADHGAEGIAEPTVEATAEAAPVNVEGRSDAVASDAGTAPEPPAATPPPTELPVRRVIDWDAATAAALHEDPLPTLHDNFPARPPETGAEISTNDLQQRNAAARADQPSTVSRGTAPGAPLAEQLADETRRRTALDSQVLPKPERTRVITISNQKGGVGKTTTTVNVAAALSRTGARVLVIDLDPQGNASTALGVEHRPGTASVYDALVNDAALSDVVQPTTEHELLQCVPATIDLAGAEIELVSLVAREQRLRRALDTFLENADAAYDYVFIDCPPSLGLLTINAFVAAREVLIPIQCEYYALEGLSQLLRNIELIERHLNPALRVSTILLTMFDSRTNLAQQVAQDVRDHFPSQVLETIIPRSVRVSEAPSYGQSVIAYDYASTGSLSYREAAAEMALRGAPVIEEAK